MAPLIAQITNDILPAACASVPTTLGGIQVEEILERVLDSDVLVPMILGAVFMTWAVFGTIAAIVKNVSRERTRREIAAYIAEGSMTPEQGERLMKAGE